MRKVLNDINFETFSFADYIKLGFIVPLTAAFSRNQITNSGLKTRLVFAVCWTFVVVETYFNLIATSLSKAVGGTAIHGYTQLQIQKLTYVSKNYHVLCIDYVKFDQKIPTFVLCSVGLLIVQVICLVGYQKTLFIECFSFFMICPVFHPTLSYKPKLKGLSSGSGFTSFFGSCCNCYMLSIATMRYCNQHNIPLHKLKSFKFVSSDDTMLVTSFYIDFKKFSKILSDAFGVKIELESQSKPNHSRIFFLGSEWINHKPYRNINRMLARIIFGNSNQPFLTDTELFQSRCFEILGNTCQFKEIYKSFRVPWPNRVFRSLELADYNSQQYIREHLTGHELRGFFENVKVSDDNANLVWTTR